MKKLLLGLLLFGTGLTLTACGGGGTKMTATEAKTLFEAAAKKTDLIKNATFKAKSVSSSSVSSSKFTYADGLSTNFSYKEKETNVLTVEASENAAYRKSVTKSSGSDKDGSYINKGSNNSATERYNNVIDGKKDAFLTSSSSYTNGNCWKYEGSTSFSNESSLFYYSGDQYLSLIKDYGAFMKSGNTYTVDCSDQKVFNLYSAEGERTYSSSYLIDLPDSKDNKIEITKFVIKLTANGEFESFEIKAKSKGSVDIKDYMGMDDNEKKESKLEGNVKFSGSFSFTGKISKIGSTSVTVPDKILALKNNKTA